MADCNNCDGHGWVQVTPGYATNLIKPPTLERTAGLDTEQVAALHTHTELQRAAAADSVYPCRVCRYELFLRWAGGHLDSRHDAASCDDCIEVTGRRRRKRPTSGPAATTPPPRKDTDA